MPNVQTLPVISVNIWSILVSLVNLVILFLIVKKALYKPVRRMLDARKAQLASQYRAAEKAQLSAEKSKAEYNEKLAGASEECSSLLREAEANSQRLSDEMLSQAKDKADAMIRSADTQIELERKKAMRQLKRDAAGLSVDIAEKLLSRELTAEDQNEFIDSFIEGLGDSDDDGC